MGCSPITNLKFTVRFGAGFVRFAAGQFSFKLLGGKSGQRIRHHLARLVRFGRVPVTATLNRFAGKFVQVNTADPFPELDLPCGAFLPGMFDLLASGFFR